MEAIGIPLPSSNEAIKWEMLCRGKHFAVGSVEGDNVTAIREVRLGPRGSKAADSILAAMAKGKVEECSRMAQMMAVDRYQQRMPVEALPFEPAG